MSRAQAKTNVVEPATTFVGRAAELSELERCYDEGARWVTLLGPGGMGKTRLALRFAARRARSYARGGGAWFIDLSEVAHAEEARAAIGAALGIATRSDAEVGPALARLGRVLLVLDNLEGVAHELAPVLQEWVRVAPSVRWLATSRRALGVESEQVLTLGPLAADDAVELFVGRARMVQPALQDDRGLVAEVVEAIDRMPLAIELAASRMRLLSTADLRARLDRPLEVLRVPERSTPRHASMRRAIEDSVELLPPGAARVFGLASVLRNGFTMDAAEATLASLGGDVVDQLDALVACSLLRVDIWPGAPARYSYFQTLREAAAERARRDAAYDEVRAAHARHYAQLAVAGAPCAMADVDNVLQAHAFAIDTDSAHAGELSLYVEAPLARAGRAGLRAKLFTASLRACRADQDALRARLHLGLGRAERDGGRSAEARVQFEAALVAAPEDPSSAHTRALALAHLGELDDVQGDTEHARERLHRALALLASTPESAVRRRHEAAVLRDLGHAHRREGSLGPARTALGGAVDRYRELEDDEGLARCLYERGVVELFERRGDAARASFDEGLAAARAGGVRFMEGTLLNALGCCAQDAGDLASALEQHAEAARILGSIGRRYREASALYYLATAHLEIGSPNDALQVLAQARRRIEPVQSPRYGALMASCEASAHAFLAGGAPSPAATAALARADDALARVVREPALEAVVAAHRGVVRVLLAGGDLAETLDDVRARVEANSNDDSRFALRLLASLSDEAAAPPDVLWIAGDLGSFLAPAMEEVATLPPRSPLRRVLRAFVERRTASPEEPLSIDEVIAAGWPGEKIGAEAALNRAYVALATLRKKGLRGILLRVEGGWALSAAVPVRWEQEH